MKCFSSLHNLQFYKIPQIFKQLFQFKHKKTELLNQNISVKNRPGQ